MPRLIATLLAVALAGVAATLLAACGEEDAQLLPGETAREITANLDTVQQLADEGDCIGAESAALQVSEQIEALDGVDPRLKQALREGAVKLNEVVAGCEEELEAAPPTTTTTEAESEAEAKEAEKERETREKEAEKEEKEREKEEKESEKAEQEEEPALPPHAEGEGKGVEGGPGKGPPAGEEGGAPSGGVSPSNPAGGE